MHEGPVQESPSPTPSSRPQKTGSIKRQNTTVAGSFTSTPARPEIDGELDVKLEAQAAPCPFGILVFRPVLHVGRGSYLVRLVRLWFLWQCYS